MADTAKKMDWRENGKAMRELWSDAAQEGVNRMIPRAMREVMDRLPEPGPGNAWTISIRENNLHPDFVDALNKSTPNDKSALAAYVMSSKPLGPREREFLARALPNRKQGRPQNTKLRGAASLAWMFYAEWRESNKRRVIKDHGYCKEMKDYAARVMAEDWFAYDGNCEQRSPDEMENFARQTRELMDKARHLRSNPEKALITFPTWRTKSAKTRG